MPKCVYVDRTYPKDALERLYRREQDGRLKERLLAILLLYEGNSITHTAQSIKVTRQTLTSWLKSWNKNTYQGLKPHFSGGYAPRLSKQGWDQVVEQIKGKGYDIEQVRELIYKEKAVEYTKSCRQQSCTSAIKMVWYKLRKQYKLPYGKAYMENKKMPVDAKERIEKK